LPVDEMHPGGGMMPAVLGLVFIVAQAQANQQIFVSLLFSRNTSVGSLAEIWEINWP